MNNKVLVLFFHAYWCHSCPKMFDMFKKVRKEMETNVMRFRDVDVEEESGVELSSKYQVRNVPTILILKADRIVERIVGTKSKEELKQVLEKWK